MNQALTQYDVARVALAECRTLDEVKEFSDKTDAMRHYARQAKDPDMEIWLAEIRIRALRRLGELTKQLEKGAGNRFTGAGKSTKAKILHDADVTPQDATRAEKIDLKSFRTHLKRDSHAHGCGRPRIVQVETVSNGDGTHFMAFRIPSFPAEPPLLIAQSCQTIVEQPPQQQVLGLF